MQHHRMRLWTLLGSSAATPSCITNQFRDVFDVRTNSWKHTVMDLVKGRC